MEDFVTFEIAKKLKEKGFPQDIQHCIGWYPTEYYKNACIGEYFEGELQEIEDYFGDRINAIHIIENEKKGVIAPTISQVLKWLREEKKYHIEFVGNACGYLFIISDVPSEGGTDRYCSDYSGPNDGGTWDKYEDCAIASIEYVLDNLI